MPAININNYVYKIALDFKKYLDEGHQLCILKNVNFNGGRYPDYSDIHVQQYFLLRFAYGYAFEYKQMYQTLFARCPAPETLNVASIGCGAMIDYWGLARALDLLSPGTSVNYSGIDIYNWNYRIMGRSQDRLACYVQDAVSLLEEWPFLGDDVYIFPNSISEFSDGIVDRLCTVFRTSPITRDRVHLMVALRRDKKSQEIDIRRVGKLVQAFLDNGFTTQDTCDQIICSETPDKPIKDSDKDFIHPGKAADVLKNLHTKCIYYRQHGEHAKPDCEKKLSASSPLMYQRNVYYTILTFERKRA